MLYAHPLFTQQVYRWISVWYYYLPFSFLPAELSEEEINDIRFKEVSFFAMNIQSLLQPFFVVICISFVERRQFII